MAVVGVLYAPNCYVLKTVRSETGLCLSTGFNATLGSFNFTLRLLLHVSLWMV